MPGLFDQFSSFTVLIIGDVMMDTYLWGKVERISPEAPVPIVSVTKRENRLGGAANVALNIRALGATPIVCAVVGDDAEGETLLQVFNDQQLSTEGILKIEGRPTTVKTRIIGHTQQIVRIDQETEKNIGRQDTEKLLQNITQIVSDRQINAIIFEDYDKGAITEDLIGRVVALASTHNIITVVDPKKKNFLLYKNVTLFKPNLKELREGLKLDTDWRNTTDLDEAVATLQQQLEARMVMVTLSERGVYLRSGDQRRIIPAHVRDIADVSGAGDTVIATAALCLAAGLDEFKTAAMANLAGGLVCEYVGVVPVNKERLQAEAEKIGI